MVEGKLEITGGIIVQEQFNLLESRVQEMIALIQRLKVEKSALAAEKGELEAALHEREAALGQCEQALYQFREEREAVRQRIGKILEVLGCPDSVAVEISG